VCSILGKDALLDVFAGATRLVWLLAIANGERLFLVLVLKSSCRAMA
jgi:hypothetical protein